MTKQRRCRACNGWGFHSHGGTCFACKGTGNVWEPDVPEPAPEDVVRSVRPWAMFAGLGECDAG